jgi:4-amino-4-deoxy-L-arabinose transferase-like glycosyltransferase
MQESSGGVISRRSVAPAVALLLTLLAFALRLSYLTRFVFHVDEFITMLAATIVARRGLPILPSGLFYDHGLLFSYLAAFFIRLLGFGEAIARWPSLLVSVLAIPLIYRAARDFFGSPIAGLVAALLLALDQEAILAGGRARMYALGQLFVLLAAIFLWRGLMAGNRRRDLLLFLLCYLCALYSHPATIVLCPAFIVAALPGSLGSLKRHWRRLVVESLILLAVAVLFLALGQALQIEGTAADEMDAAAQGTSTAWWSNFFAPSLVWEEELEKFYHFFEREYGVATLLALVALAPLLLRRWRRLTGADLASLYLAVLVFGTALEMGLLLAGTFRQTRYLLLFIPLLSLLAGQGAAVGGALLERLARRPLSPALKSLAALILLLLLAALTGPAALKAASQSGTGGYDTAFRYVGEHWSGGDKVMTVHPAASYLYLQRCDFYINQETPKVIEGAGDQMIDRYTGAPWVSTVEELNRILAEEGRIWLVADDSRLGRRFAPLFSQQIFAQMDIVSETGGVLVMSEKERLQPVIAQPAHALDAALADGVGSPPFVRLAGYTTEPETVRAGQTLRLTLYWQALTSTGKSYKIFVHLRDADNQTVAQADHDPFKAVFPTDTWYRIWKQEDLIREVSELALPEGLPPGSYRLLVGMYDLATMERAVVLDDASGENAIVAGEIAVE